MAVAMVEDRMEEAVEEASDVEEEDMVEEAMEEAEVVVVEDMAAVGGEAFISLWD